MKNIIVKYKDVTIFTPFVLILSFGLTLLGLFSAARSRNVAISHLLAEWDGIHYKSLIETGYIKHMPILNGKLLQNDNAFFPTFPYLTKYLDKVLPGGIAFSGLVLNIAAVFISIILFRKLAEKMIGKEKSYYATVLLFLFPGAFIFYWFYAEAITILFIITAMHFLVEKKVLLSSFAIALATFTRPNAAVFAAMTPIYILATGIELKNFESKFIKWRNMLMVLGKAIINGAISISGFFAFMLILLKVTGEWGVWFRLEREGWGESKSPFKIIWQDFSSIVSGDFYYRNFVLCLYAFLGIIGIGVLIWYVMSSKFEPIILAMSVPSILVILLGISNNTAVASPRFTVLAVPIFIALASKLKKKYLIYLCAAFAISIALTASFYSWRYNSA